MKTEVDNQFTTLINCTLNVAEIKSVKYSFPSPQRQGFNINVTLEPWRVKELICSLWNKFPDEFEECLKDENWIENIPAS